MRLITSLIAVMITMVISLIPLAFAQQSTDLTPTDLLGQWQCDAIMNVTAYEQAQDNFTKAWKIDDTGLLVTLPTEITFTKTGVDYQMMSTMPNPIAPSSNEPINSKFTIKGDYLVFKYDTTKVNTLYEVRHLGDTKISLSPVTGGFYAALICDKILPLGTVTTTTITTTP